MLDTLAASRVFAGLPAQGLAALAEIAQPTALRAGEMLFRAGEPCTQLYVVSTGRLEILGGREGRERTAGVVSRGDVLGTHAALEPARHGVGARATVAATVLAFDGDALRAVLGQHADVAVPVLTRIGQTIARRLRHASDAGTGLFQPGVRIEHDLLGERAVPSDALYGVQTLRATENFDISGIRLAQFPSFIRALARVKQACARANHQMGLLDEDVAQAIDAAAGDLVDGRFHGHFVVDMVQGGAGTSTNMNVNEVIANRALERLGHARGDYERCHPNNHVNRSQSTNDVYPTALRIAAVDELVHLQAALKALRDALQIKSEEFASVLKMGRTQLQDAVPMTLGQEFRAFAVTIDEDIARLDETSRLFYEVNLGGTAIGTGINTPPGYAETAIACLAEITGLPLTQALDLVEATPDTGAYVLFSGVLKRTAIKLSKMCNDLRLLSSGPRCGFGEIELPAMQPGSSIMPGKVNPVIPEVVNQVAFRVIGNDTTITMAAHAGQLQLNVMEPILAFSLFESMSMLRNAIVTLTDRCVVGIRANEAHCRAMVEGSVGIVTAAVPYLGYEKTSEVAKDALATGRKVREIILERGYMDAEKLDEVLSIAAMTGPRLR